MLYKIYIFMKTQKETQVKVQCKVENLLTKAIAVSMVTHICGLSWFGMYGGKLVDLSSNRFSSSSDSSSDFVLPTNTYWECITMHHYNLCTVIYSNMSGNFDVGHSSCKIYHMYQWRHFTSFIDNCLKLAETVPLQSIRKMNYPLYE